MGGTETVVEGRKPKIGRRRHIDKNSGAKKGRRRSEAKILTRRMQESAEQGRRLQVHRHKTSPRPEG